MRSVRFKNGIEQLITLNHGATRQHDGVTRRKGGDWPIEYEDVPGKEDTAASIVGNIEKGDRNDDEEVYLWGIVEDTRRIDGLRKQK